MKFLTLLSISLGACAAAAGSTSPLMPTLHQIQAYTFSAPYSCKGSYVTSALFLSETSKRMNEPDLLYNGACGSEAFIQSSTAGDDISMIADLGNVPIEKVSASRALNYDRMVGRENVFKDEIPVMAGHTYVVLISKAEIRALWVLHVESMVPDREMTIRYAVESYSIQATAKASPGFDWDTENK